MNTGTINILAIDTATAACSAAVLANDTVHERFEIAPQRHAELILPMIEAVLTEARLRPRDLQALAFGHGPGTFTGVRIATAIMQGIALGTGLRLIPVSSLAALACGCQEEANGAAILSAFDARRGEVYLGGYQIRGYQVTSLLPEQICAPDSAPELPPGTWIGTGPGFAAVGGALTRRYGRTLKSVNPDQPPRARHVAMLAHEYYLAGNTLDAAQALPSYLRDQVAQPGIAKQLS